MWLELGQTSVRLGLDGEQAFVVCYEQRFDPRRTLPMAAIAYPGADRRSQVPSRRHLALVPPPAHRRSRSAIYWRRRLAVLIVLLLAVVAARAAVGALG